MWIALYNTIAGGWYLIPIACIGTFLFLTEKDYAITVWQAELAERKRARRLGIPRGKLRNADRTTNLSLP